MKINNNKKKKRIGVYRHECVRVNCVEQKENDEKGVKEVKTTAI